MEEENEKMERNGEKGGKEEKEKEEEEEEETGWCKREKKMREKERYGLGRRSLYRRGRGGRNERRADVRRWRSGRVKSRQEGRERVNGGKEGGVGKVVGIQYDPNRTGRVGREEKEKIKICN